jgi:hemerythrin
MTTNRAGACMKITDHQIDNFFQWENDYATGIQEIDHQHKEMIMLVRDLFRICYDSDNENQRNNFLELALIGEKYIENHFLTEEEYMLMQNYPQYEGHKKRHDKMLEDTKEMVEKITGEKKTLLDGVIFIREWLDEHINSIDKDMGEFLYNKDLYYERHSR